MHTRNLLVASLSLLATAAVAQTQYAWSAPTTPNGEGLYRFNVDAQTGALGNKTLVSKLRTPRSWPSHTTAKRSIWQAKWSRAWCRRCGWKITAS